MVRTRTPPLDWASHSLSREFAVVIMVEVLIEEMFGPDLNRPIDYRRAVVINAEVKEHGERTDPEECTEKFA
jgi:hypothetical protein